MPEKVSIQIMNSSSFLILFIALIALMAVIPFLLKRIEIPQVIALLLVGMLIGPSGVNLVGHLSRLTAYLHGGTAVEAAATASAFNTLIATLGSLGLMFLMALAGMEADFKLIRSVRIPVLVLSVLTFSVPALAGYFVYRHYLPHDLAGKLLYASLFASHSVGIVFPVIRDLKLSQSRFGATVLISTVITDIASIILLAVSVQIFRRSTRIANVASGISIFDRYAGNFAGYTMIFVFLLLVLAYLTVTVLAVKGIGKWVMKHFKPGEDVLITIILAVILGAVVLGELCGINLVVGAFIAGLALSTVVKGKNALIFKRFESIGYGFLIPFLFISIGMSTDFSVFGQKSGWAIALLTVIALVGSKILSGFAAMRLCAFKPRASFAAGLMTVPQLSATLAAAAIGKELGILQPVFFNAIIVLSIVTTLPVPTLVRLLLKNHENDFHNAGEFTVPQVLKDEELL